MNAQERRRRGARLAAQVAVMLVAAAAVAAHAEDLLQAPAGKLVIKPRVCVSGGAATVADVLWLREADQRLAAELGGQVLAQARPNAPTLTLTHDQIAARLEELGVNPARVTLGGALQCQVTFQPPAAPQNDQVIAAAGRRPVSAPNTATGAPDGAAEQTLAEAVRASLGREFPGADGLEVAFERAEAQFLDLTSPPFSFDIRSGGQRGRLGLREVAVYIRRDNRLVRSLHLGVNVRLTRAVAVAARPLSAGSFVRREDVRLEPRLFDGQGEEGCPDLEPLIGQQVTKYVPPGELLTAKCVKSVDLVKRSAPVALVGAGGAVQLRVTGVALDSGGHGEVVRVRVGDGRKDRREVRGVVIAAGTVRIVE